MPRVLGLLVCYGCFAGFFAGSRVMSAEAAATPAAMTAAESPVRIARVWTAYRDAKSFARFGQFRGADREPGDAIILRSQPEQRDGYYFTVRLRAQKGAEVPDGTAILCVAAPNEAEPRTFSFPFTANDDRNVQLLIGLTGHDWTWGATMPLAWRIEVLNPAGELVAAEQSFLWSKP